MIWLYVSYDCGAHYSLERSYTSTHEQAFMDRTDELDRDMLRWYIKNDEGDMDTSVTCAVHKGIIAFLQQVNNGN